MRRVVLDFAFALLLFCGLLRSFLIHFYFFCVNLNWFSEGFRADEWYARLEKRGSFGSDEGDSDGSKAFEGDRSCTLWSILA